MSEYVQKGLSLGMVSGTWPSRAEINAFHLGSDPNMTVENRTRNKTAKAKTLTYKLQQVEKGVEGSYEVLADHFRDLGTEMLQKGAEIAIVSGTLMAWWQEAASILAGKAYWHSKYIIRYFTRHLGFGIPETVSFYDMIYVIGRVASTGGGASNGESSKRVTALEEKVVKLQEGRNILKQKVESLEKQAASFAAPQNSAPQFGCVL